MTTAERLAGDVIKLDRGTVASLAVHLLVRQHLPVARCAELLGHLGANVSTGWVGGLVPRASERLAGWLAGLWDRLATEPVLRTDETSGRPAGSLWWFHVVSTKLLSVQVAHQTRGRAAVDDIGVLGRRAGQLVHDRLALYWVDRLSMRSAVRTCSAISPGSPRCRATRGGASRRPGCSSTPRRHRGTDRQPVELKYIGSRQSPHRQSWTLLLSKLPPSDWGGNVEGITGEPQPVQPKQSAPPIILAGSSPRRRRPNLRPRLSCTQHLTPVDVLADVG